jgi:hypothetical protein
MRPKQPALRQCKARVRRLDQQRGEWLAALEPPHRAARQHDVIAGGKAKVAVVAVQIARAFMHKQQFITVRVARKRRHAPRQAPETHAHRAVE